MNLTLRNLEAIDLASILELSIGNAEYHSHLNEAPTYKTVAHTFQSLPPGTKPSQKVNQGVYAGEELVAYLEMVKGYPEAGCAMIGLLMVKKEQQGKGLGSRIVSLTLDNLRSEGYSLVYLSCSSTDGNARRFWANRGFVETGDVDEYDDISLIAMEKEIS